MLSSFDGAPYTASITEGAAIDSIVSTQPSSIRARDDDLEGQMTYELTGVYPAQDFFTVNPTNAEIRVEQNLKEDSLRSAQYQLEVVAYDSVYPQNRATAMVTVAVERNPNQPKFVDESYSVLIDEKHKLGTLVMQVRAQDDDQVN